MFTEYKAVFHGIKTVYVNPAKTSRRPPNGKKLKLINYRFTMLGDTVTSRDVVASWNTALRGLEKLKQMRSSRVTLSPDNPRSEAMKTRAKRGNPETRNTQLTTNDCLGETLHWADSLLEPPMVRWISLT